MTRMRFAALAAVVVLCFHTALADHSNSYDSDDSMTHWWNTPWGRNNSRGFWPPDPPVCFVSNGLVSVHNIDPLTTHCVWREDDASFEHGPPRNGAFVFGKLARDIVVENELHVTLCRDVDCKERHAAVACTPLPPPRCTVDDRGLLHGHNLGPEVRCVRRSDRNVNDPDGAAHPDEGCVTFTPGPVKTCGVELILHSDADCADPLPGDEPIVCPWAPPPPPPPPPPPVVITTPAPTTPTEVPPTTPPPTEVPPTTPPPTMPPGPFCTVNNQLVLLENIPSDVLCIRRSDTSTLAFPSSPTLLYGALSSASTLVITLYRDDVCLGGDYIVVECTQLPPTTCIVNKLAEVIVSNVGPAALCVGRGDIPHLPSGYTVPIDGVATFPTPPATYCGIEIHLFGKSDCTSQLQAQPDIFCTCQDPLQFETDGGTVNSAATVGVSLFQMTFVAFAILFLAQLL